MNPHFIQRRTLLQAAAAATLVPASQLIQAQDTSRPIKMIVPLPAGGAGDVAARALAEAMAPLLGTSIVVDNKPGGLFQIAMQALNNSPADGNTILQINPIMCTLQVTQAVPYDISKLALISTNGSTDSVLIGSNNAPFKTASEMVTWARANPGKLTYAVIGNGGMEHLLMAMICKNAGITGEAISFKGGPDAGLAIAQGQVMVHPTNPVIFQMFKDKVRGLGTIRHTRGPNLPDMPTLKEQGLNTPHAELWTGYAAPAGTSPAIVERLGKAMATALQDPALKKRYETFGLQPYIKRGDDFTKLVAGDIAWMGDAVKALNLKLS